MLSPPPKLTRPGLFVTATDTEVGKTTTACAIAWAMRREQPSLRVGVCKPLATGCRLDREGLVSPDAEALAHFADCRQPLEVINPVRFKAPLAPAAAASPGYLPPRRAEADAVRRDIHLDAITQSLLRLDQASDAILVEGIGGLLVPLSPQPARAGRSLGYDTVLDLIVDVDYPVLVVARAGLGTLNHTAMTVELLRRADCRVAGVVLNGYEPDVAKAQDPSVAGNRQWIEKITGASVLAVLPRVPADQIAPQRGRLPAEILEAAAMVRWADVLKPQR